MRANDLLIREKDKKEFKVVELSHWSLITSVDALAHEEDRVKWIGADQYVGSNLGGGFGDGYRIKGWTGD